MSGSKNSGFLMVPRSLVGDRTVRSSDVRVIAVLIDLQKERDTIDHGLDVISKRTGLTKRTVCEVLNRLEQRGLIVRDSRRGPFAGVIQICKNHASLEIDQ